MDEEEKRAMADGEDSPRGSIGGEKEFNYDENEDGANKVAPEGDETKPEQQSLI